MSYLIVDDMHAEHPELIRDQYWDSILPDELPYTGAGAAIRSEPYMGSTVHLAVSAQPSDLGTFAPPTPQLHRLDEGMGEDGATDEEMLPLYADEAGSAPCHSVCFLVSMSLFEPKLSVSLFDVALLFDLFW